MPVESDTVTYRTATADDVDALARLRWLMEVERHPEIDAVAREQTYIAAFRDETRDELERGTHRAWLAEANGEAIACVLLIAVVMPPNLTDQHRRRGIVSSVYTMPTYRRRGISRHLMSLLIEAARAEHFNRIVLWASDMGRPLYVSLGFVQSRGMDLNLG